MVVEFENNWCLNHISRSNLYQDLETRFFSHACSNAVWHRLSDIFRFEFKIISRNFNTYELGRSVVSIMGGEVIRSLLLQVFFFFRQFFLTEINPTSAISNNSSLTQNKSLLSFLNEIREWIKLGGFNWHLSMFVLRRLFLINPHMRLSLQSSLKSR